MTRGVPIPGDPWRREGAYLASAIASNKARCVPRTDPVVSNASLSECAPVPRPPPPIVTAGIFNPMGTFESVEPSPKRPSNPKSFDTAAVVVTIGEFAGVCPGGRIPTSSGETETVPRPGQR